MKKVIALFACVSLLAACEESDIKKNTPAGSGSSEEKMTDDTDLSLCSGAPTASDLRGAWQTRQRSQNFVITTTYVFENGVMSLTNVCESRGRSLTARASSPYSDNGSQLTLHRADDRTERIDEAGFSMSCGVSIPKLTIRYSRSGACIKLHDPEGRQGDLVLAPYRQRGW